MSCSKDSGCLKISNDYHNYMSEISNNGANITSRLSDVSSSISLFDIPSDYIGNKVMDKIKQINNSLANDNANTSGMISNINAFASLKSEEHLKHYKEWQIMQERMKQNKKLW